MDQHCFDYYLKDEPAPGSRPQWTNLPDLSEREGTATEKAQSYKVDPPLLTAVNVALALGKPLLVTGEPGTGKTQLAYYIADRLGLGDKVLKFEVKSTTEATELFYRYDTLARFGDEVRKGAAFAKEFIDYDALGKAYLLANAKKDIEHLVPSDGFDHPGEPARSVVLIDEIDKAPRDVPNDILNEIAEGYVRIRHLPTAPRLTCSSQWAPVVVFTSNSEKSLPDAFLRRCIYYDIPFPERERLQEIVAARVDRVSAASQLVIDAVALVIGLRKGIVSLDRTPGTAELIDFVNVLKEIGLPEAETLRTSVTFDRRCRNAFLDCLIKKREDREQAHSWIEQLTDEAKSAEVWAELDRLASPPGVNSSSAR